MTLIQAEWPHGRLKVAATGTSEARQGRARAGTARAGYAAEAVENALLHSVREAQYEAEAIRLHGKLRHIGWSLAECELIAPITLEINELKQVQNAVILAHSYQTSRHHLRRGRLRLATAWRCRSKPARHRRTGSSSPACASWPRRRRSSARRKRCFTRTRRQAAAWRTASPAEDVRALKAAHPGVPVVAYVNTSAEVKAEADACCTSANTLAVVEAMPGDSVIFIPDKYMAANLRPLTNKTIIGWDATCIVHENFGEAEMRAFRKQYPDAKLLAHTECHPGVVDLADMAGSTSGMEKYIEQHPEEDTFMLVTECGMTDKLKAQYPERRFVGACVLCPYMKKVELRNILQAMQAPRPEQVIELEQQTIRRARRAIDVMLEVGRSDRAK